MNEMDQLTRFRDAVPVGVTPRAEELFRAGLRQGHCPERAAPRRASPRAWARPGWRLGVIALVAAALVAGIVVAVQPSPSPVLTARLLADRASAAALARPPVNPGQWVYREIVLSYPGTPNTVVKSWQTANAAGFYGDWSDGAGYASTFPDYAQLGSLPRDPAALDAYLGNRAGRNAAPDVRAAVAFNAFDDMLSNFVLPPALQAEAYQALALLPGIEVDSHVTTIAGQVGVAFVQQPTATTAKGEIILSPFTYAYLAQAVWLPQYNNGALEEQAVKRMVLVDGPGSTRPGSAPPSAAGLLAEQAEQAASYPAHPLYASRGTWIARDLATSSGSQRVWATADDSQQASYVNGKLRVCARSAACASSTRWLMPAGPGYEMVDNVPPGARPKSLALLLAMLNSYSTGCADVAGDCNAVTVIANVATGYANEVGALGYWFLLLAEIPGVTAGHVTDVAGRADVAFRFPFTGGVTQILLSASTYQVAGYVRDGIQTVITREAAVSGPGSLKPALPRPRAVRRPA